MLAKVVKELETKELKKIEQEEVKRRLMMYEPFVQQEWLKSVITGTFNETIAAESIQPI